MITTLFLQMYFCQFQFTFPVISIRHNQTCKGSKSEAKNDGQFNEKSNQVVDNRFSVENVPMCGDVQGIYGMVPPEGLHTFGNSLYKNIFLFYVDDTNLIQVYVHVLRSCRILYHFYMGLIFWCATTCINTSKL